MVDPWPVSRFTETDRNGPKRTFVDTETDSLSTETDSLCTETDRNGPKRTFVDTETDSLSTETDSLGTETDFCEYRNGLCGYRIVIWGVKVDRNTKNRFLFLYVKRLRSSLNIMSLRLQ